MPEPGDPLTPRPADTVAPPPQHPRRARPANPTNLRSPYEWLFPNSLPDRRTVPKQEPPTSAGSPPLTGQRSPCGVISDHDPQVWSGYRSSPVKVPLAGCLFCRIRLVMPMSVWTCIGVESFSTSQHAAVRGAIRACRVGGEFLTASLTVEYGRLCPEGKRHTPVRCSAAQAGRGQPGSRTR